MYSRPKPRYYPTLKYFFLSKPIGYCERIIFNCCFSFTQVRDYNGERTLAALTKFVETDGEGADPVPTVVSL